MTVTPFVSSQPGPDLATLSTEDRDAYLNGVRILLVAVQELSMVRSLDAIQAVVRRAARQMTGCDGATFVLRDNEQCHYADEDAISPLWKGSRFPLSACISGWAMLNRQAVAIPDIYADDRIPHDAYRPTFVKSLVMAPIRQSRPIGAIGNYWAQPHQPQPFEIWLLQSLADATSIAMENVALFESLESRVAARTEELQRANAEIRKLAITDELTGLSNRRGFYLLAEAAIKSAARHQQDCSIIYLDLDNLKKLNDREGHEAGDELIRSTADLLRNTVRVSDVAARLGGDEFCVLAVNADGGAKGLVARLRARIEAANASRDADRQIAMSMGVQQIPAQQISSVDWLLSTTDALMYQDKQARKAA